MKQLSVNNLSHSFGPAKILQDINLRLDQGETIAVVGPSGSGKSTLLRLCAGLLDVETGELTSTFKRQSFAFQDARLLPWQTALDNIAFGLKALGVAASERRQQARVMGLKLGLLESDLVKFPSDLSGGMRQRVSFSRALLTQPDLLFLDEPFSALDIGLKRELQLILLNNVAERGMAVFFITHDLTEAARLANRMLVLAGSPGKIAGCYDFEQPAADRDDHYVNHHCAALLSDPLIIENFDLRVGLGK